MKLVPTFVQVTSIDWLWSPYGIGQTIIFSSCRLFFFLLSFFFLSSFFLISDAADWMSAILPHMVWPKCEFKMQVWNLLHADRWKHRMQSHQKSPSGHHRTTLSCYIFATKACIDNPKKKLVKQRYVLHMSPQYGELRPTSGWDRSGSLRHPCKFQWFRVLAVLLNDI